MKKIFLAVLMFCFLVSVPIYAEPLFSAYKDSIELIPDSAWDTESYQVIGYIYIIVNQNPDHQQWVCVYMDGFRIGEQYSTWAEKTETVVVTNYYDAAHDGVCNMIKQHTVVKDLHDGIISVSEEDDIVDPAVLAKVTRHLEIAQEVYDAVKGKGI